MRILISFAALILSVILLQLSSGGVGPLDALSGLTIGFTRAEVGLLGSAHFLGFFIGCWWAPRLMGSVGHSRAFAAFTAAGAIGLMSHMLCKCKQTFATVTSERRGKVLCCFDCDVVYASSHLQYPLVLHLLQVCVASGCVSESHLRSCIMRPTVPYCRLCVLKIAWFEIFQFD